MKFAACWRYESSFSTGIPALSEGVFVSCCSEKYHRFGPMGGDEPWPEPGTMVEFVVDDITPKTPSTVHWKKA